MFAKTFLFNEDPMTATDKIPGGFFDMVLTRLPSIQETEHWNSPIPLNDYVELKKERYERDNFFKLMYVSGATVLQTRVLWDDLHQEGLWKKIKKILKPDGTVIILSSGQNTMAVEKNNQFPLRNIHNWHKANNPKEVDEIEKILVFSLFTPCEKTKSPLPQDLMYPAEYRNIGKENGKLPVILCKRLIETYTLPGQRILDINMTDDSFLKACRNTGRHFTGIKCK